LLAADRNSALLAVPLALLLAFGLLRVLLGSGYGLLPLLAVGPAAAAAVGTWGYTLAIGVLAMAEEALITLVVDPGATPTRGVVAAFLAIAGVSIAGAVASQVRCRREQELNEVRAVADVTQRVLLRPVPDQAGPLRLAARYVSASTQARIGGDLYAAVATDRGVRLIVGDAEGKGLPAVQEAAAAMATFRAAARQEYSLAAVAARLEATLNYEFGDEQFVTAVLADISPDGTKMEMINCGHPPPLQLGPAGAQLLEAADCGPPLGLGLPGIAGRVSFTVPLRPGEPVLFYTDGLSEARNGAGEFFPLTEADCLRAPADPPLLLELLSAELYRYVGHKPLDDVALLLIERTTTDSQLLYSRLTDCG
jgi:serine phosphatase RsbU (regulator of sigma subunit)